METVSVKIDEKPGKILKIKYLCVHFAFVKKKINIC